MLTLEGLAYLYEKNKKNGSARARTDEDWKEEA
jgi:hypothetical protein